MLKNEKLRYEHIEVGSKTVPGMAHSIKTVISRFSMGIPMDNIQRRGYFEEDPDIDLEDPFRKPGFDLSDIDEAKIELEEINSRIKFRKDLKQGGDVGATTVDNP